MNALSYLIIGIGALSLWHLFYENVVVPSLRLDCRFKLFALRDRLRDLKFNSPIQCEDATFHMLDDSLSWQMDNLPKLNFVLLRKAELRTKAEPDFKKRVDDRCAILRNCQLPEYKKIQMEQAKLTLDMLVLNSGGWAIYLVPVAIVMFMWDGLKKKTILVSTVRTVDLDRMTVSSA